MAGRKPKLQDEQVVVEALKQSHGLKTGAAEILDVSFNTLEKFIVGSPAAQEIVDHYRRRRKDRAEYMLDAAIERGEAWAVMFTLKNARDREYNDRVDVNATVDSARPQLTDEGRRQRLKSLAIAIAEEIKKSGVK